MTNQEIFDKVAAHLLKQGTRSRRTSDCAYRGDNGTSCAVGCLIADEHYDPSFEGIGVYQVHEESPTAKGMALAAALKASGVNATDPTTLSLLRRLQIIHDQEDMQDWSRRLADVAKRFGLNTNALDKNHIDMV